MKQFDLHLRALCGVALVVSAVVTFSSCTEEVDNRSNQESSRYAPVSVHVKDFAVSMADFPATRAAEDPADYNHVQAMTLAFYEGATEVCKVTQLKDDHTTYETFGDFTCSLPLGAYTMVVVARDSLEGDVMTLTSPTVATYTSEKVRDTFAKTLPVVVNSTAPMDLGEITLNRVIARVGIVSTDLRPANAAKIRTTFGGGSKTFSPTTGLAADDAGFVTVTLLTKPGATIGIVNSLFLAADEEEMDVTIEVLDANDEVLYSKLVEDVPLKRNRMTKLTGALFTATATNALLLETTWLPELDLPL